MPQIWNCCQCRWRKATQARVTSFETASEGLSPKSTARWEYDRGALRARCVSFICMPSASRKPRKKLHQQRVNAVVPRGNTVSRLDLSDFCFVDDLVSPLIFLKEEPTLQIRRNGVATACEQKQAGGTGWSCRTRCASHQCRNCPRRIPVHISGWNTSVHHSCFSTSGVRWSLREARAQRHRRGSPRPSRPRLDILVGSSFCFLEHQNQAVADAESEHFAVCSRSSCVASERRGNAGKSGKTVHCDTLQDPLFMCLESARKTSWRGLE